MSEQTSYRIGYIKRSHAEVNALMEMEKSLKESDYTEFERLSNFPAYITRQDLANFLFHYEIFKMVIDVPGSICEMGVCYGGNLMGFAKMSAALEPLNYTRKIIGFDTFEGFPSVHENDTRGGLDHARVGGMGVDAYEEIKRRVALYDLNRPIGHIPKVELVKGDINQTVPQYLKDNPHLIVSLLYIDVDIYEPTKTALKHLLPRMPKGAVLAFDELNHPEWPGETMALVEELGLPQLRLKRMQFDTTRSYAIIGE